MPEICKSQWDKLQFGLSNRIFANYMTQMKKWAKQAFVNESVIGKLPIEMQHALSKTGKQDASLFDIKTDIQRRCVFQKLMPSSATPIILKRETSNVISREKTSTSQRHGSTQKVQQKL